jgi:hypothetical protein
MSQALRVVPQDIDLELRCCPPRPVLASEWQVVNSARDFGHQAGRRQQLVDAFVAIAHRGSSIVS